MICIEWKHFDEEMREGLEKMWYSEKFATPLKYELTINDAVLFSFVVTEIIDEISNVNAVFTPPSEIMFQETGINLIFGD